MEDGIEDVYSRSQPSTMPKIDKSLIGKRLEILYKYEEPHTGEEVLEWNQGVVTLVSDGTNLQKSARSFYKEGEAVLIDFDKKCLRGEKQSVYTVKLKKSKWNPKNNYTEGSWRLDLGEIK